LVKVLRDPSNRPYAFVQYTNDADAKKALREGQHSNLDGRTIRCEPAKVNRTLYIATANDYDVSLTDIREILATYGEIEQIVGDNDSSYRKSNLNRAWFCQFAYRDDAIRAYANLRLSPDWIVEWAQNIEHPSEEKAEQLVEIDKFSIFVGQLDAKVTKDLLNERFSRHGKIAEIVLVIRPGNNFSFIKFATEKAAAAAVERENHAVFMDKTMHVQYRELHHKRSRHSSQAPRLSLAPPPVNLPVRRASTGSGFRKSFDRPPLGQFAVVPPSPYHRSASTVSIGSKSKFSGGRSVSFTSERSLNAPRFFPGNSNYEPDFASLNRVHIGSPKDEDIHSYSPTDKHTPVSSPSNHTMNSSAHGEAKSVFTTTSVSASEHNAPDDPAAYGSKHPHRRTMPHIMSQNSAMAPPPSYYYYAFPKDYNMQPYDNQSYLPYTSHPYFYPENGLVDFPQVPPSLSNPLMAAPGPYYMYYGVPQTPNSGRTPGMDSVSQFPEVKQDELDY
jgi:RNA recognition motif-containing protein